MNYCISPNVIINCVEDEVIIYDMESGFSGKGNKCAYMVFRLLQLGFDNERDIIEQLKRKYNESQHSRIEKSVPNILVWAAERKILKMK